MADQKQLWEINDVILNNNYSRQDTDFGPYYTLATSRSDLPAAFYASERDDMIASREEAETLANLSGRSAQDSRHAGGTYDPNYQLPSEKIANADGIADVISSGERTQGKRGKKKKEKGGK